MTQQPNSLKISFSSQIVGILVLIVAGISLITLVDLPEGPRGMVLHDGSGRADLSFQMWNRLVGTVCLISGAILMLRHLFGLILILAALLIFAAGAIIGSTTPAY